MKIGFILPSLWSVVALAQSAGTFTGTGSMTTDRIFQRATVLFDGRVLVTGGTSTGAFAELYDPATGTFTAAGNMVTRYKHTATLLPDGKVLIAGGYVGPDISATAELYDPSSGTFAPTGNMNVARQAHVATLLASGKVLVAGGEELNLPFPQPTTAELYDPITGRFTSVSSYASPNGHLVDLIAGATLLPNGRVLIAGNTEGIIALYDPVSSSFVPQKGGPARGAAVLLNDGRVLVAGGDDDLGSDSIADVYDPWSAMFNSTGSMTYNRSAHTATLLPDGTVLVAGGDKFGTAELYDPLKGTFSATGTMTAPREAATATLLRDGTVLIVGSRCGYCPAATSAEIYHPAVLAVPPAPISVSGDGRGQGVIWHPSTAQIASSQNPAVAGEVLSMYTTSLVQGSAVPPQVAVGGRFGEILFFGNAPGYPGFSQVNFRVPDGVTPGPAIPVRMIYLGRPSNELTIGIAASR